MDGGTEIATTLHRFSVHDYNRIADAGMLDDHKVELIRGAIVEMAAIGSPHSWTIMRLTRLFAPLMLEKRAHLSVQNPLRLDHYSEAEPDVVLVSWDADQAVHPRPVDALLVIEVADRSLGFDRAVRRLLCAEAGIGDYWIVNLVDRVVEVHRDPGPDGYRQITPLSSGRIAPLTIPDFDLAIAEMLPPV